MNHGFNLEDDLVCVGIIGDGCGGGRIFTIKDDNLVAYDPQTHSYMLLLEGVVNAIKISKEGCSLYIKLPDNTVVFDLSTLQKV